jgi:hypothetical protein
MKSPSAARLGAPTPGSVALSPSADQELPPDRPGLSRAGALTGLAGAVLYLAGALLPGSTPKPDAPTSQLIAFFAARQGALLAGFSLELAAVGLLLCFLGYLHTVIAHARYRSSGALATSMVAAWVATVAITAAGTLPAIAIIWHGTPSADPALARFAYDIQTLATYAITSTTALVSIGAPSLVIWRARVLPRWLSVLGAAEIAVNVAELFGLSSRHGPLAGGYAFGAGPLLWVVWFAAAGTCMALKTPAQPGPQPSDPRG